MILEVERHVAATPERAWTVVGDVANYADHVEGLSESIVLAGTGADQLRRCTDTKGRSWDEACVAYEPGRLVSMQVDVSSYPIDLRLMFRAFEGTWEVEPHGAGSTIRMRFRAEPRRGLGWIVRRMAARSRADLEAILDSYESALQD